MPRQPKTVCVHRGNLTGHGLNKTAAKADLDAQIDWLLKQTGASAEVRFGHVIIVAANPAAAAYDIRSSGPTTFITTAKPRPRRFVLATPTVLR
jgi:hypothetical protein